MSSLTNYEKIVRADFLDIVNELYYPTAYKIRLVLVDHSYVDIFLSLTIKNIFAFHWERRHIDDTIYRYDNYPHKTWKMIKTYPYHFHDKSEQHVIASPFRHAPEKSLADFLMFVREKI